MNETPLFVCVTSEVDGVNSARLYRRCSISSLTFLYTDVNIFQLYIIKLMTLVKQP